MRLFRLIFLCLFSLFSISVYSQDIQVTFLHVNDVYQFMPVDGGTRGGLARLITLKNQIKRGNPNTIFTLGGDTISPSV